jgi:hypothetical protein
MNKITVAAIHQMQHLITRLNHHQHHQNLNQKK